MRIGKLQEHILSRLFEVSTLGKGRVHPHAGSYAYAIYDLRVNDHDRASCSKAVSLLENHGLIGRDILSPSGTIRTGGKIWKVKSALVNRWAIKQEILFLTDAGAAWVREKQK